MKKNTITVLLLLFTCSVQAYSDKQIKKLSCVKAGTGNTQCIYEVKGQKIDMPDSVSQLYGMSSMPYALCSSALCKFDKAHPESASCECKVLGQGKADAAWRHASVGPLTYEKSKPVMVNGELTSVTSNFSYAELENRLEITPRICSFAQPTAWANCFGVSCVISKNANYEMIATCKCPIIKTTAFVSMGPKQENQCVQPPDKVWSATSIRQADNDFAVIEDMYTQFYPN